MATQPLYTDITELFVFLPGQTIFGLDSLPTDLSSTLVIYNHLAFHHTEQYDITPSPDILTWTGITTEAFETLYLLSDVGVDALFNATESLYVTEDGQIEFALAEGPADASVFMIIFGGLIFLEIAGDFTVTGRVVSWSGVTLTKGELLRVIYKKES